MNWKDFLEWLVVIVMTIIGIVSVVFVAEVFRYFGAVYLAIVLELFVVIVIVIGFLRYFVGTGLIKM